MHGDQGRDNHLVGSTKGETANQKWPNLKYKTYSQPYLCVLCPFLQSPVIISLFIGVLINHFFFLLSVLVIFFFFFFLPICSIDIKIWLWLPPSCATVKIGSDIPSTVLGAQLLCFISNDINGGPFGCVKFWHKDTKTNKPSPYFKNAQLTKGVQKLKQYS
jgi:hypothetical protein